MEDQNQKAQKQLQDALAEVARLKREAETIADSNQKAQKQLQDTFSEVERLNGVAKEIEDGNKIARVNGDAEIDKMNAHIDTLHDNASIAQKTLDAITESIKQLEIKKAALKENATELEEINDGLVAKIEESKRISEETKLSLEKQIDILKRDITAKQNELAAINTDIETKRSKGVAELQAKKTELDKINRMISEAATELTVKRAELKDAQNGLKATDATTRESIFSRDLAQQELDAIVAKIEKAKTELASITTEKIEASKLLKVEQEELKKVVTERIASKTFIEQLNNREAVLRKKYEDVGLEYK